MTSGPDDVTPLGRIGAPNGSRRPTLSSRLRRLGFADVTRSASLLDDKDLLGVLGPLPEDVLVALGATADPDLALLQLARLSSAAAGDEASCQAFRDLLTGEPPATEVATPSGRDRLLAVLGASVALGDELVSHPDLLAVVADPAPGTGVDAGAVRAELLRAVEADAEADEPVAALPAPVATDAMRRAYRSRLLRIAATDLTSHEPLTRLPAVAAALADLAAAALEASLAIARSELDDHGAGVRLAVMGMGKCGGRELNYVSDVDVVYVAEPADGYDEAYATSVGARLATGLARACQGTSSEPPLWPVDAALRPEGKNGPLVRTLASHLAYYERWAKTWEFQALLKARLVAGDRDLGAAYHDAINPFVWSAVTRENFVEDSQAMRRRVEDHVPAAEADRQLKLGKGGLRDVEFTVQLLQLVHGRADDSIRSPSTLTALAALAAGGYVGREHAARLAVCYRFLRSLEHRIQLFRLRRTHLVPTGEDDLRRLARSLGMRAEGAEGLLERWRSTRREVRALHEELFYRPLLPATAQLSAEEASLAPEAAKARFQAIGYRDPAGAMRHVLALTEGVSRRAAIQRQLLPVMLGWFAEGADPDAGLLNFRKLSEELGSTHWYLKLLRDSGSAAYRLATLLSSSRYMADALSRSPESVAWLADDADLVPRGAERLAKEADAILTRADVAAPAATALRAVRRRELARTGAAEILGVVDPVDAARAISDAADLALVGGLRVAQFVARGELGVAGPDDDPARFAIIAMGRLGGREMGYGSDADVMFVHEPVAGASDRDAQAFALVVATRLRSLLGDMGPEPGLPVDADLRPEGRNGPLVRSFDSYAEYYDRWSAPWESQALLRARPAAGDAGLGERFMTLVDPLRYPAGGLDAATVREVRRIKARVESERLPRGVDPSRHLKLGRGGVSDVEWTVQLLQLQHAHEVAGLRTTSTIDALEAAALAGIVTPDDAATLGESWHLASRLRSALVLWSGRSGGPTADVLPHEIRALSGLARVIGDEESGAELEERYLRTARRARAVMERVFYGED
ncbi:bifunctional [glutamine synthetase] adenylyltransferase/[glutamine synthetase]-adenylyl-L-tyrosine phosphorylase [Oerskovia gallyi]|uniref:Bifunctional glutamine synthetase adenylyltransferase/adenylyl-removing enzyme n=1 Tax=Oerskovia gallyi TaxID=2762226 RepID=A0ABR8UXQ1_9CELL|nr:bifunctional [glutamine synthetase] adenylyltransferase/[glutamine synthetase]-adenylyl-L-tyrosine phosphorylase [Oerskovia gallyi]MBD7997328.1 bifunctional [glutamine synthetase] adenylyltransferase/[glutamine synthetase]-adenylyl-L-tyrosine phosphorylase [Oerskovia gallyi]